MIRRALIPLVACIAVAGLMVGGTASGHSAKGKGKKATVELGDDFFNPTTLKIKEGTTVLFDWVDTVDDHNVTKRSDSPGPYFESMSTDEPGVQFRHKFNKKGTYELFCSLHDEMTMTVKVKRK